MIVSMRKLTLIGAQEKKEEVLKTLQKAALLHLLPNQAKQGEKEEPLKEDLENIERIKKLLTRLQSRIKEGAKAKIAPRITDWRQICQRVDELLEKRETLKQKIQSLKKERVKFLPWGDFSLNEIEELKERGIYLQFFIASSKFFDKLDLSEVNYYIISREGGRIHFVTISLGKKYEGLSEARLPQKSLSDFNREIAQLEAELEQVAKELKALAAEVPKLEKAQVEIRNRIGFEEARNGLIAEGPVFILQGWIPKIWIARLKKKLGKFELAILEEAPKAGEDIPVILDNKPALRPFELITDLYSRPQYHEIDTTPIVSPFFAIFFAMCLTDAGYGIVMFALATLALKFIKLSPGLRKGLKLLQTLALFIIGFGLLTGSIFNIQFSEGSIMKKLTLIDASNQMNLFAMALIFGIVQLSSGIILKAINQYRAGEATKSVGSLGLLSIFLGAIFTYLKYYKPGISFMIAGALLTILFSAPVKNPLKRVGLGLWSLYGGSGLLGDLLSYSRLFALALATGIIAQVINTLALQVKGIPLVGWPAMILVLVLGHLGNIALGMLSGFVHTVRLQFVEFYKQFYSGGGTPFVAFQEQKIK